MKEQKSNSEKGIKTKREVSPPKIYTPVKPPISYYGGKQRLVKEIIPLIPTHEQYVEPFFGGGAILFAKQITRKEVINDIDNRVINFYRVLQSHFNELDNLIKGTLHSESDYTKAKRILKSGLTSDASDKDKINFAWAFWIQCNLTFSNKIGAGFAFGNEGSNRCAINTHNKKRLFTTEVKERFEKVEIFCRDAVDLIKVKDTDYTFFYLDPPYFNSDCGHYKGYTEDDFIRLLNSLTKLKGKFLLSSYNSDILQKYIKDFGWNHKQMEQHLAVMGKRDEQRTKTECLTWNYNI